MDATTVWVYCICEVKLLPALLLVLIACQSEKSKETAAVARADEPYRTDVQKICDSMSLSGADKLEKLERVAPHSKWLGENIATREAQMFLVNMKQLADNEAKAKALEAEAKRVGLTAGCALANVFRAP